MSLNYIRKVFIDQFKQFGSQGILFTAYNDEEKIIYLEPNGCLSLSIVNAHIAILIVKGQLAPRHLKLPDIQHDPRYYCLKIPLPNDLSEQVNPQLYIKSSDLQQDIVINGNPWGRGIWLFCTPKGVKELRGELSPFLNQLTLVSMTHERTLSTGIAIHRLEVVSILQILNRYGRIPFLPELLTP